MDKENKKINVLIPINLQFFEKTEEPTEKRKKTAREEGQVAKSQEIGVAVSLIASFLFLKNFGPKIYTQILEVFFYNINLIPEYEDIFAYDYITRYVAEVFFQIIKIIMPMLIGIMVVGIITSIVQVGWSPTSKAIKPDFKKINPLSGFKRLFSPKAIIELLKSILKLIVIGNSVMGVLEREQNVIFKIIDMELTESSQLMASIIIDMGISVGTTYLTIGLADFAYQKFKHRKTLMMTKEELKEEYKQAEGDPVIKGQIKQRMREASMRRMMQDVQTADVIITNPTHFAIALRYNKDKDVAPIVVAKGIDFLAQRIKENAKEHNIHIVENKALARALYATCDVGKEIPQELYQSVAEILAYVYKLNNVD